MWPADQWGCGHYRAIWPAQAVNEHCPDIDVTIHTPGDGSLSTATYDRVIEVHWPDGADVVVFQRPAADRLAEALVTLADHPDGPAVVIDMDDDLSAIDPNNGAYAEYHPARGRPGNSWETAQTVCDRATLVTTTTPALTEKYGRHAAAHTLPNLIPPDHLTHPATDTPPRVVWPGSTLTHPADLQPLRAALTGLPVTVIGPCTTRLPAMLAARPADLHCTGPIPFDAWAPTLAAHPGVGIAPLADTKFNHAKSWLKPLELAATGHWPIMTPTVEYTRFHQVTGIGDLCDRPKQWRRAARHHLTHPTDPADIRGAVSRLTLDEPAAHRWATAWRTAHQLKHGTAPQPARRPPHRLASRP